MKRFYSFVRKEYYHIFRDRRTMLILLVMPIVMIILFGFAITNEVKNSRVAFLDYSKDAVTSRIRERFANNAYFIISQDISDPKDIDRLFRGNEIDLVVSFSEDFGSEMLCGGGARVQIIADGSEPNQAATRVGYAQNILMECAREFQEKNGGKAEFQIEPVTRMLYNPQGRSEYNFVPGVIGLILMLICAMMTSIAIVREKEQGTMEVLLASPLPPIVIVLSKLVPYFVISCINFGTILVLSWVLLNIPVAGSILGFMFVTLLYILVALLLGLFISTCVNSQLAAMLLSLLLIVPTVYLSGLAFPIESMPESLQRVSSVFPARWYVSVARKIMIQGVEMKYVLKETVILSIMAITLLCVSWKLFKTRL
ncbi:MAG: ABC transporter permease [Muribaculaceae bacterium]